MKTLLIGEYKNGTIEESTYELVGFAKRLNLESAMFIVGKSDMPIEFNGKVYIADINKYKEYEPDLHTKLIIEVINKENPDYVVFSHSSYGWDISFRVSAILNIAAVSEVVDVFDGGFVVPCCNSKFRRNVRPKTNQVVLTLQAGAFDPVKEGSANVESIDIGDIASNYEFLGYKAIEKKGIDLTKADIIVSVGRGIGKKENVSLAEALARALGAEMGASRPVVDAGWLNQTHQVGTTGQTVSPKLYIACGISGAIQHLAGMKKSNFIVAINKDRDAPISEVADVFIVADLLEIIPLLTQKLQSK